MDYFESYEDLDVHKCMLEDTVRNNAYKLAILENKEAFRGKSVLDVGAGTGVLSIFCAQAGAARVYAVEASEVYKIAQETVEENNVSHIVQVIHNSVENISLPEDGKVDIIISEWMGHFLLHEGMLDSVIAARDKFLRPGGLLFPENAILYSAPCSIPSLNEKWKNINGVSMTRFAQKLRTQACQAPKISTLESDHILSDPEIIWWIDLREITSEDLNKAELRHRAVIKKTSRYQGICIWFTCSFPSSTHEPIVLSTEPGEPETHWKQTMVLLPIDLEVDQGAPVCYDIRLQRSDENLRRYNIEVEMLDPDDVEHPDYCSCIKTKCILTRAVLEKYEQDNNAME